MVEILPLVGIFTYAVWASLVKVFTGTVITKVSVGQFVVWPGAQTGTVYVYVPAAVAVNV